MSDPTDEVLPCHSFDDTVLNRLMAVTGVLRYDPVLDADKLRDSLTALLHIGDWRKLRGRLRLNSNQKIEIHVPKKATRQRPAIRFRQTILGLPYDKHPLISKLAQPTATSSVRNALASLDDISKVLVPLEWPQNFEQYVDPERDEPILGLHILTFTDTTLVVLCFSHIMTDGTGIESLLQAWSHVLHGREDAVAPLGGVYNDPLDTIRHQNNITKSFVLSDQKIELASLMPEDDKAPPTDPLWDTSSPESRWRSLSISPQAITGLFQEANEQSETFISEDDIVTAWLIRTVADMFPESRPINTMRLYDMRPRLPVFDPNSAYLLNLYQMAWTLFSSAGEIASSSLGAIASKLRSDLLTQTAEDQVIASMLERDSGNTPLYGSPVGAFFTFNSWFKMKIYQRADFNRAVMDIDTGGGEVKTTLPGQPTFVDFDFALGGAPPGPNFISLGKDARGARHAMVFLSNVMWPKMEAALKKLDEDHMHTSVKG